MQTHGGSGGIQSTGAENYHKFGAGKSDSSSGGFPRPGGVGKTWIIEQLVKIIKGRMIYLKIKEVRHESSVNKMLGSEWSAEFHHPDTQDKDIIGELPLAMIAAGCTNPIIFIDELRINDQSISDLNLLLDPLKRALE